MTKSIVISGPPAVGKTTVAKGLAKEFNLPYNEYRTMRKALVAHFRHLGVLGQKPELA